MRTFVFVDDAGTHPIAGIAVVGYRSLPQHVELAAPDFERHLATEGLEGAIRHCETHGGSAEPGREIFSRAAKSLLAVGGGRPASGHDRVLGLTLELIPERSPWTLRTGDELPVVLRYEGKPLAGVLVTALHGSGERLAALRSDKSGRVRLPLARSGIWL